MVEIRRALAWVLPAAAGWLVVIDALAAPAPVTSPVSVGARDALEAAEALVDAGRWEQAIERLEKALPAASNPLRARGLLAVAYQAAGRKDEAVAQYTRMLAELLTGPDERVELLAELGGELMWLVNRERLSRGIRPLKPHPLLCGIAQQHCEEMRDMRYFGHLSPCPDHTTPADRFCLAFGFRPRLIAENVARRRGINMYVLTSRNIKRSHNQLMASPGHRRNILMRQCTDFGVGIAANDNGDYWITEVFVQFR